MRTSVLQLFKVPPCMPRFKACLQGVHIEGRRVPERLRPSLLSLAVPHLAARATVLPTRETRDGLSPTRDVGTPRSHKTLVLFARLDGGGGGRGGEGATGMRHVSFRRCAALTKLAVPGV